jgi:hypothetical protein
MVEELARHKGRGRRLLRNQLGTAHVLAIPVGGIIESDFGALSGTAVGRVLVARGEVDIVCDWAGAVLDDELV